MFVLPPTVGNAERPARPSSLGRFVWGRSDASNCCGEPVTCLHPVDGTPNHKASSHGFGGQGTFNFRGNVGGNVGGDVRNVASKSYVVRILARRANPFLTSGLSSSATGSLRVEASIRVRYFCSPLVRFAPRRSFAPSMDVSTAKS